MSSLLERLVRSTEDNPPSFAAIRRQHSDVLDVFVGQIVDIESLAEIPLGVGEDASDVLVMVPFHQVTERGFPAHNDDFPLRCLVVSERDSLSIREALNVLPTIEASVTSLGADTTDAQYADMVRSILSNEIGRGEGANFVISRTYSGTTSVMPALAVLAWLRSLLMTEQGAYWTFALHSPGHSLIGATPERHVSVREGIVTMNPISGTFRHPAGGPTADGILKFLSDHKESEELFMVVDEELKMMSTICPDGGRILGPFLKQMSRVSHTEYLLEGRTNLDPRDVLRATMFAPTVTGSPMENACSVIKRYEPGGRGYYSGVLALFEAKRNEAGSISYELDAPIIIRTAHLDSAGRITVSAGASLVRLSSPEGEAEETYAKASSLLTTIGLIASRQASTSIDLNSQPGVAHALAKRNDQLAPFWVRPQGLHRHSPFSGRSALIVDCEDEFSHMLAHQLRHLGMQTTVVRWDAVEDVAGADLVVFGPGPGDPRDSFDKRIGTVRRLINARLRMARPLLAVCLSHQILAMIAGLDVVALSSPRQGVRLEVDVFGQRAAIGFYNTFSAVSEADGQHHSPKYRLAIAQENGHVTALRGDGVSSIQGHLESVLSPDGLTTLERLVSWSLAGNTRGTT